VDIAGGGKFPVPLGVPMLLTSDQRRLEDFQHLRWRLGFCQTLLEMHQNLPRRDAEWYEKETALLMKLKETNEELRRADRLAGVIRFSEEAR
jgi:hypothetical protein